MQVSKQSGAALAVSLFMLGVLTLIGIAAISSGTVNYRLVNNLQVQEEAEKAVQGLVETYSSEALPFGMSGSTCNPDPQPVTVNGLTVMVDIDEPICLGITEDDRPLEERDTSRDELPNRNVHWEVRATTRDPVSGARTAMRWGLFTLLANGCPARTHNPCS
jgi:hypothetical protein